MGFGKYLLCFHPIDYSQVNKNLNIFLSYLDLARKFTKYTVFAIDDDVIASGKQFSFETIGEVVEESIVALLSLVSQYKLKSIALGGWSYGGVVAYLVAKSLIRRNFVVSLLVTFDAPLRSIDSSPDLSEQLDELFQSEKKNIYLNERAKKHFASCTKLLNDYYLKLQYAINIPISYISFKPDILTTVLTITPSTETTISEKYIQYNCPGDHWTMIFEPHATDIAQTIENFRCEV